MSDSNNFSSDKPVEYENDDRFQRYAFSKRIADTIIHRKNTDCIVIGVYGAWGEGKTSVINFIEKELDSQDGVLSFKFNPWRFTDENTLLLQFFEQLGNALETKLSTKSEEFGKLLKKYSGLLSFNLPLVGSIADKAKAVSEILGGANVEVLKKRVEEALVEAKVKIVVFIDDIDRLDKDELHTIFRLVKLNGDFSNLIYVLAFDEKMVASSIGVRFGEGNQASGEAFLEKIVQVPLSIPKAQPEALNKLCYSFIDKTYINNKLQLDEDSLKRFAYQFNSNVLLRVKTPRLAVRYGNTISFAVPLLKGEVNLIDLFLIEAVKVFYPTFYDFIKNNPEFFIGYYSKSFGAGSDDEKKNLFKQLFEDLCKPLSKREKDSIKDLLHDLFPILNQVFLGITYTSSLNWQKDKRICSSKYFNRYFSYSVIEGELSDLEFDDFLSGIEEKTILTLTNEIREMVNKTSPEAFINKLRVYENDMVWSVGSKLAQAVAIIINVFRKNQQDFQLSFEHPSGQIKYFIKNILKHQPEKVERAKLTKNIIVETESLEFACDFYNEIAPRKNEIENLFEQIDFQIISKLLVEKALDKSGERFVFDILTDYTPILCSAWKLYDDKDLSNYLKKALNKNPKKAQELVLYYAPIVHSSSNPKPYRTNFSNERYEYFKTIFDVDVVYKCLLKSYKKREYEDEDDVVWVEHGEENPSKLNIVKQFAYWYNQEKKLINHY